MQAARGVGRWYRKGGTSEGASEVQRNFGHNPFFSMATEFCKLGGGAPIPQPPIPTPRPALPSSAYVSTEEGPATQD